MLTLQKEKSVDSIVKKGPKSLEIQTDNHKGQESLISLVSLYQFILFLYSSSEYSLSSSTIQRNLTGSKISTFSTKSVFSCRSENLDGHPDLWLTDIFSTSPLEPLIEIWL